MKIRRAQYDRDKQVIKDICDACGSANVRAGFSYLHRMVWQTPPERIVIELVDDAAVFVYYEAAKHFRCVVLAVRKDSQRRGIGRALVERWKQKARNTGKALSLRTSAHDPALLFWLRNGFTVTGTKGEDIEMRFEV